MKIVVVGGTGFIGTKCVAMLQQTGHEVIAASPGNHVDSVTGEGLTDAFRGADVVIDLTNSPSYEDTAVKSFFQTSGENLLTAAANAGVKHHLALSIVGIDRMQNIGYMRGKMVQEELIKKSDLPYTIVRSTQFFEFLSGIADQATHGNEVTLSNAEFQPIAADEVATLVTQFAMSTPANGIREIAGPDRSSIADMVTRYLQHVQDPRRIILTGKAEYYGQEIAASALTPLGNARLGNVTFQKWLSAQPGKV